MDNHFWERVDAWRKDPTLFKPVRWWQTVPGVPLGVGLFVGYVAISYVWEHFGPKKDAHGHGHGHGHQAVKHVEGHH